MRRPAYDHFYILFAILIFGVLIAIHEFGHFIAAKACGVRVEEFAIGMGPALWKKQGKETLYSLRAIPFGGYCAMTGEDEASSDPRAFTSQPAWKRIIILAAGAFMNFVLGLVIVCLYPRAKRLCRARCSPASWTAAPMRAPTACIWATSFTGSTDTASISTATCPTFLSRGGDDYDLVMIRDGKKVVLKDFHMVTLEYEGQEKKMFGFYLRHVEEATLRREAAPHLGHGHGVRAAWSG